MKLVILYLLLGIHVILSIALILIVLLQTGKGSDLASAFGGGGANAVFGGAGPTSFLNKVTTAVAVLFMVTSISLAYVGSGSNSIMPNEALPEEAVVEEGVTDEGAAGTTDGAAVEGDSSVQPGETTQAGEPGASAGEAAPAPAGEAALAPAGGEPAAAAPAGEAASAPAGGEPAAAAPAGEAAPETE